MSCKYLTKVEQVIADITARVGTRTVRRLALPACKLGRPLDQSAWAARCRSTAPEGPCWYWVEQRCNEPDPAF